MARRRTGMIYDPRVCVIALDNGHFSQLTVLLFAAQQRKMENMPAVILQNTIWKILAHLYQFSLLN